MIHVVWEHMLGLPGPKYTDAKFARRLSGGVTGHALALWVTNERAVREIWRMWDAEEQGIGIITYLPAALRLPLAQRLRDENIPHRRFVPSTPQEMAHRIALRPDITRVVDGDPSRALTYGPKGVHLPADSAHLIGLAS